MESLNEFRDLSMANLNKNKSMPGFDLVSFFLAHVSLISTIDNTIHSSNILNGTASSENMHWGLATNV